MKLTVLGCGDAFGNGGRNNTAFLLSENQEHVLIDCGASTLIRLKQEGVDLDEISTIIISHFHGDHFGGIPFLLISSLFENERKKPLHIVGPKGVEEKVKQLQEVMYPGTADKLIALDLSFHEYQAGRALTLGSIYLVTQKVEHSPPSNPHGIRLEWDSKVFAFSGDTSWTDHLLSLSKGADLFICECNFLEEQAYGHLSYNELLSKREMFECGNIWLTHMGAGVLQNRSKLAFDILEDGMKMSF